MRSGADPAGLLDSTAAINHWLATPGCTFAPPGRYKVSATLSPAVSGVHLFGTPGATSFVADDSAGNYGDMYTISSKYGCSIRGIAMDAGSVRSAGYAVRVSGGDTSVKLSSFGFARTQHFVDVDMNNQFNGVLIEDASPTNGDWGTVVGSADRMGLWRNFAAGGIAFDCQAYHGGAEVFQNTFIYGDPTPANGPVGVRIRGTGGITMLALQTWGTRNGVLIDPQVEASESVCAIKASYCYFDFSNAECVRFNPIAGLVRPIVGSFSNCWIASCLTTHNIRGSNGTGHTFFFRGGEILNAAGFGLRGDTGCTSANFAATNTNFGPPLVNASGDTSYL